MTARRPSLTAMLLAALGGSACTGGSTEPKANPPNAIAVVFAGGTLRAELATLAAQRSHGLMDRATIAADSGMMFVWAADQTPQVSAFHMLNTHVDLDIAFIDANRRVINVDQMTKETTNLHFATAPFRYALEAPKGWFAAHGVVAGTTAVFAVPAGIIIDP